MIELRLCDMEHCGIILEDIGDIVEQNSIKPLVWVTQENPKFDYTPAEKYGELRFITCKDYTNNENSLFNSGLSEEIMLELREFNPDVDYLLPSGSPVVMMAVAAILGRDCRNLKILKWNNRNNAWCYNSLTIEV